MRRPKPSPAASAGVDWRTAICVILSGLSLLLVAVGTSMAQRPKAAARSNPSSALTISVHLDPAQFAKPPTFADVIQYYQLDPELIEPTRAANAGSDGTCRSEPLSLPTDVVLALSEGNGRLCVRPGSR